MYASKSLLKLLTVTLIITRTVWPLPVVNFRVAPVQNGESDSNDGIGYETSHNLPNHGEISLSDPDNQNNPFVSDTQFFDLIERDTQQQAGGDTLFAGDVIPTITEQQTYLQTFGYLSSKQDVFTPSEFEYGYVRLQHFTHLPITGKFDYFTSRQMTFPRCGMVDMEDMQTPGDDRQLPAFESDRQISQILTYNIRSYPDRLDRIRVEISIAEAMQMWQETSCTKFQRVSDADFADITFSWETQTNEIFGEPKAIAFTVKNGVSPITEKTPIMLYMDQHNYWTTENTNNASFGLSIARATAHNIGHVLGLSHSDVRESLMWPFYDDNVSETLRLHESDINSLRSIYGQPCARQFLPPVTPQGTNPPTGFATNVPTGVTGGTNRPTGIRNIPNGATNVQTRVTNIPITNLPTNAPITLRTNAPTNVAQTNAPTSIRTNFPTTTLQPTSPPRVTPTPATRETNRPSTAATPAPPVTTTSPFPPRFTTPKSSTAQDPYTNPLSTKSQTPPNGISSVSPNFPYTNPQTPISSTPPNGIPSVSPNIPTNIPSRGVTNVLSTAVTNVPTTASAGFKIVCPFYPYPSFELKTIPYPNYANDLCRSYAQFNRPVPFYRPNYYPPYGPFGRPYRKKRSVGQL